MQIFSWSVKTQAARERLSQLRGEIGILAQDLPERAAQVAVEEAKGTDRWKDRTGRTRASITASRVSAYKWRFLAGGMSMYLNFGTGVEGPRGTKYPITGHPMLRFFWQKIGLNVALPRVMHQGVKKTLFVNIAKNKAADFMMDRMFSELNQAIRDHNR